MLRCVNEFNVHSMQVHFRLIILLWNTGSLPEHGLSEVRASLSFNTFQKSTVYHMKRLAISSTLAVYWTPSIEQHSNKIRTKTQFITAINLKFVLKHTSRYCPIKYP